MHGLQGIPSHSFYRHNTNIVPNSPDSRVSVVGGGKRRKRRTRRQRRTKTNARNIHLAHR